MAKWVPDWEYIYGQITSKNGAIRPSRYNLLQAINPLLLNNGDIVFNTHGAMVRMGTCSAKPIWILDEPIHHTNELGQDNTIWSPSISTDGLSTNSWLKRRLVDDSIAHISADGRLLKNLSFSDILIRNNLQALLLGSFGKRINVDPIHMNKISEATISTKHWEKGDLLISARHLSAVFLYRPSSDKIIWYKVGPWMNQHSAEFVGDHKISVLSNNALSMAPSKYSFIKENDINRVFIYDFSTQTFDEPYRELLELARPKALSGGVAKILPDGGLFFEETDSGRHLRFSKEKLIWSRVNDYDSKSIGSVAFSRYLDGETAIKSIEAIQKVQCNIK